MFGRPRCREWTPLATQQLRLRNLIQIVGYNIRPPEWCPYQCSFYLTLHHTTMSAPYYTSERICSPHPKWKEIDPEITQSLSSTNVVIRVWSHAISADENIQDTVIQTWGVYLSGLRYIGANLASNFNSDCFKSNTLVFQMHGGYFCSYKSLKIDVIPPENDHSSLSSDSSGRTNAWKNLEKVMESSSSSPHKFVRRIDSEYSKSHSPVEKGFQHHIPTMRTSTSLNIRNEKIIYEHSPERNVKEFTGSDINCDNISKNTSQEELFTSMVDLSETAEMYDLRNEYEGVPKYRYLALNFLKSEIRPSYTASKLQKLHILQYSIKKKQEAVQDIKERIYNNLALNYRINLEESFDTNQKQKCRSQRSLFSMDSSEDLKRFPSQSDLNGKVKERAVSSGPRLGLKLNDLLSYKVKPSPFQRSEHIRLTKQLEILRFKRIILSDERDSKLANIRRLKERHAKLAEENQDVGTELMQNYHTLSRCTEALKETRQSCAALRELAARSHASLSVMRTELLTQLHQIFYIEQVDPQTWSIVSLPLRVCSDEAAARAPAGAAAACALAAQALVLAAGLLDQPPRYSISLRGSATTIRDVTPDLPDPNIPLYPRGGDVTLFRYAMFLLNKCIGQLLAGRGMPIADIRPTLFNLQRLLTSHNHLSDTSKLYGIYRWLSDSQCPRTQSLRSLIASERGKYRQFNRFKDAIDGQSPQSVMNVRRHRHSRSVGSYHDEQELAALNTSTTSIMGSESNIYNMKLPQNDSNELNSLTKHNSEPELQSIESDKVLFSLGDTAIRDLESQLVRLSTNNGDEITCHCQNDICQSDIDVNVTRICTEINDFCSQEIQEGFDVAKYMEDKRESVVSEIEEADKCMSCEGKGEGECQLECAKKVTDVIVIPSAEAILDTGQNHGEN